jgi:hypothetical protein
MQKVHNQPSIHIKERSMQYVLNLSLTGSTATTRPKIQERLSKAARAARQTSPGRDDSAVNKHNITSGSLAKRHTADGGQIDRTAVHAGLAHGFTTVESPRGDAPPKQTRRTRSAPKGRNSLTQLLTQTHLAGVRIREEWLIGLAEQSSEEAWSKDKAGNEVRKAAIKAIFADHITTESSFANLVAEGTLATDPAVRDHVPRLIALRDAIWGNDPDFLRDVLHGPSQTLVDLMRRHKRASERHHTASVEAYLTYLRRRFAA